MFCCKTCAQLLLDQFESFNLEMDSQNKISISSLIDWPSKASDSLSLAVHLLKLAAAKPAWKFFAMRFAEKIRLDLINEIDSVLVPIPGHKPGSTHTEYFSQFLSEILGLRKINLICAGQPMGLQVQATEQKKLTKQQRISRPSNFYVDFTRINDLEGVKNLILIDDIVTTGATLVSCVDLLQSETNILEHVDLRAWVLFRRTETNL